MLDQYLMVGKVLLPIKYFNDVISTSNDVLVPSPQSDSLPIFREWRRFWSFKHNRRRLGNTKKFGNYSVQSVKERKEIGRTYKLNELKFNQGMNEVVYKHITAENKGTFSWSPLE